MQSQKTVRAVVLAASLGGLATPAIANVNVYLLPMLSPVTIDANVAAVGKCVMKRTRVKGNPLPKNVAVVGKCFMSGVRIKGNSWLRGMAR